MLLNQFGYLGLKMGAKKTSTAENFVANLRFLMRLNDISQTTLAKKSGVSQKSISNILNGNQIPSIEMAEQLAAAFGLEGWHMIMPNLPDDLRSSSALSKLYKGFIKATPEGRKHIEMVAEREAAYSQTRRDADNDAINQ